MEKQQNRARVFIADGSADFRLQCAQYLRRQGVEVVGEAADGREAFARIARAKPNVVISELYLSKLDGAGLIRECKKQLGDSFPAFIMMSSFKAQKQVSAAEVVQVTVLGIAGQTIDTTDNVVLTFFVNFVAWLPSLGQGAWITIALTVTSAAGMAKVFSLTSTSLSPAFTVSTSSS